MAEQTKRQSYPYIPERNWWDLRKRFVQSPPSQVTAGYLMSVLGLQEASAKQLLPPLRLVGLVDENGRPTELARDWRSEDRYSDACRLVLERSYPQELLDSFPPPNPDRTGVKSWFMWNTNTGDKNAAKLANFYCLLSQGDPSAAEESSDGNGRKGPGPTPRKAKPAAKQPSPKTEKVIVEPSEATSAHVSRRNGSLTGPSLHIDIQIHIAADAKAEQIDLVFASMARHLGLGADK